MLAVGQWLLGRQSRRQGRGESMTGIIVDQS
jgi:hypothetical protein